jgi:hypothetical protein
VVPPAFASPKPVGTNLNHALTGEPGSPYGGGWVITNLCPCGVQPSTGQRKGFHCLACRLTPTGGSLKMGAVTWLRAGYWVCNADYTLGYEGVKRITGPLSPYILAF